MWNLFTWSVDLDLGLILSIHMDETLIDKWDMTYKSRCEQTFFVPEDLGHKI